MNENNNSGWVKIHRSLLDWEWFDESKTFRLFIYLLLKANHAPKKYRGVLIDVGQIMTGLNKLSDETGLSVRSVRTCLKRLKSTNEITIKSSSKGTIIQVVKYKDYQVVTSKTTNERQTNDKRTTTNKNYKNIKKIYDEQNFLEDWSKCRKHYLKKPTHIKKLDFNELNNFKNILVSYTSEEIKKALHGLFKQQNKNISSMYLKPKHFLENFDKYYNAELSKDYSLYGTQKQKSEL